MKKILVISPSGEVYDHDCVRWYTDLGYKKAPEHYHNIGDAFVFDSSLKLLRYTHLEPLKIRAPSEADIERYNSEYDYAFLRGSNYLHQEMYWENAPSVLARLKIPIVAFGIGAQAPSKGKLVLNQATRRVLALIAERSVSLGVRGSYTADVLWSLGIRNARIIACPTVFRNNDPGLRIDLPPLETVRDVAYTLRREVDASYAQDLERYLNLQRQTILDLASRFNLDVLAQGEVEEKGVLWGDPGQRAAAIEKLRTEGWLRGPGDPLEKLYATNLFYSDVVTDFEQKLRQKQLVLGYRLHGNLLGLANRVPSVYFTYDSRTAEFAETLQIPSFDVFSGRTFRLEDYWDQSLFERFNRAYYQTYRAMRLFLDENGVSHKMVDESAAARVARGRCRMSEPARARPEPAVSGYVEAMTETEALGWVWSPGRSERLTVELRLDGQAVARAVADGQRADLARSGIGDGRHAFALPIPEGVRSRAGDLRVYALFDGGAVPLDVPPSPEPAAAQLAHVQRGIDMLIGSQRLMHRNLQSALLQQGPSSATSLTDVAAAQAALQESIATVELFAVRLEQALALRERPAEAAPSRRGLALVAGVSVTALVASCCALARTMLG